MVCWLKIMSKIVAPFAADYTQLLELQIFMNELQ
jgi:hypothetical protein